MSNGCYLRRHGLKEMGIIGEQPSSVLVAGVTVTHSSMNIKTVFLVTFLIFVLNKKVVCDICQTLPGSAWGPLLSLHVIGMFPFLFRHLACVR